MSVQGDGSPIRVPTLSQCCYRFINSHLDCIDNLGGIPYRLVEPVLRSCSAEQLLIIEKNSPHLRHEDQDVWRSLCFRDFRTAERQYQTREFPEPDSWRKQYFICRSDEQKKLEEVGSRIKSKRQEVEEEKKERQVVYTDRLPPAKRTRFNSGPSKPKTLFEKTRAESIRIQRSVYGPAMLPSMPVTKTMKPKPIQPKPARKGTVGVDEVVRAPRPNKPPPPDVSAKITPSHSAVYTPEPPPASGGRMGIKKDPMATLFMPKHRAHSQLLNGSPLSLRCRK